MDVSVLRSALIKKPAKAPKAPKSVPPTPADTDAAKAADAATSAATKAEPVAVPKDVVPLAVFVTPSVRRDGNGEVRTNGRPPDNVIAALRDSGLRYARTTSAWSGPAHLVEDAVERIDAESPGCVSIYDDMAKGISAWSATPRRTGSDVPTARQQASRSGGRGPAAGSLVRVKLADGTVQVAEMGADGTLTVVGTLAPLPAPGRGAG